jgi:acyl-CoA thioesterase I
MVPDMHLDTDSFVQRHVGHLNTGDEICFVGLGDSLTDGWLVSRGFFDRALDILADRFPRARIRAVNAGVPGDTARGGARRLARLWKHGPRVLCIQFGLNDVFNGISAKSFEENIDGIVRRVLKREVMPVLITSCPLRLEREQRAVDLYYDSVRNVAASRHVPLADLETYWRAKAPDPQQWEEYFQNDGIHPTDAGHALMAQGLAEKLASCCSVGPKAG